MSVYELSIDPTGAEKGAQRIVKSFQSIQDAAGRMETSVTAKANKIVAAFSQLSRVRTISREAITQLQALSSALGSFRGPSKAAVDNTTRFLSFLNSVGRLTLPSGSRMAAFLAAMNGYRGPTATAGRNTESLLRALSRFTPPAGLGSRITGLLAALSGFRGPHANAGRNATALLNALSSFRGSPRNISAAIAAFDALAQSISRAATAMGNFRRSQGGNIRVPSGAGGRGSFNPRQYANDLGFLNTAIFRTQTAFHALGGVLAAREFIMASNNIIKIKAQLEAATGSTQQANVQFKFLREYAEKLGLEFTSLSKSYGFFLGAIKGTNVTFAEAKEIFTGFSTAARALQLSTADVDGVFRALGQIMSKGKLQAEELRGQLGDRLPGAFVRFARALDMTKPGQLDEALKKGAISGDKLKNAIIDVARTMEVEFAASADKMSKTVDAAFNRLKNAFTFAAADAGQNGLNDALISLMDTLTKFIQSDALSNMLSVVAGGFQLLAKNIELVTYALGFAAVAATLKWAAALSIVQKAFAGFMALRGSLYLMSLSGGFAALTGGTITFARAMTMLGAVIRAHPIFFLTSAIFGLVAAYQYWSSTTSENQKALEALNSKTAEAENFAQSYTERLLDLGNQADSTTRSLYGMIDAMNQAALRASQEQIPGLKNVYSLGGLFSGRPSGVAGPNGPITGQDAKFLARFVYRDSQGNIKLRGSATPDAKGFEQQSKALALLRMRTQQQGGETFQPVYEQLLGRVNAQISMSRQPGYKGNNYAEWANQLVPDYNRETQAPGISGDVPEKSGGGKKGRGGGVDQYEQDIRRAMEALRDLRRETSTARAEIDGYLTANADLVDIEARGRAEDRVNQLMDTFKDPATAERGLIDLNSRLREQGDILQQLSPAAQQARQELIAFYAAEEAANIQAQKARDVAKRIDELRFENDLQKELIDATVQGGSALEAQTRELEIQRQTRGMSLEDQAKMVPLLREQMVLEQQITRSLQMAEEYRSTRLESANLTDTAYLYSGGYRQDEIDYYKELIELQNELRSKNYTAQQINDAVAVRAAILNQRDAMKELQEEYERNRQLGQDMADAIVNGFQDAIESGENFFKSIKDIFSNLKKIILQFVLYDPLRQWLTEVFTMGTSGASQSRVSALGGGVGSSIGGALGGLTTFFGGAAMSAAPTSMNGYNAGTTASVASLAGGLSVSDQPAVTDFTKPIVDALYDTNDIIVKSQYKHIYEPLNALPEKTAGTSYFSKLGKIFDWKGNQKAIGDMFKGGVGKLSETLGPAMQALGSAFAAFSMGDTLGKGLGKALGLGDKGSSVLGGVMGGAAAGFSLGGPVGAAVGAVAGGLLGLFTGGQKKERQYPVAWGGVNVDQYGIARIGQVGTASSGTRQMGEAAGSIGARIFNQMAIELNANLRAGNYGVFGQAAFSRSGEDEVSPFYSLTGQMNGIHPAGRLGVDYVKGTESEIQAWAVLQQFRRGMFEGLSQTMRAVLTNTQAKDMESLTQDIAVGKSFEDFLISSYALPEVTSQIRELEEGFRTLSRQAKLLGLNETALANARQRLLNRIRDDFNFSIQQGILEITDPRMAAYNELVRQYRESVDEAIAVGGNLAEVERLYGLRRAELLKQTSESAFEAIRESARDLLEELTASQSSPLAGRTILSNAAASFTSLRTELLAGNTTNADQLGSYAQNYLQAAYEQYGSSTAYFDIFRSVTEFLQQMENYSGGALGGGTDGGAPLPELPALQDLVDEITARNAEIAELTGAQTEAIVEIGSEQLVVQEEILAVITNALNNAGGGTGVVGPATGGANGSTSLWTTVHMP